MTTTKTPAPEQKSDFTPSQIKKHPFLKDCWVDKEDADANDGTSEGYGYYPIYRKELDGDGANIYTGYCLKNGRVVSR